MNRSKAYQKRRAKARQRRRRTAQERLARDRRQAQHAAAALQHTLDALELPKDLVTEIEDRLRSQQKLLGKILTFPLCCFDHISCWLPKDTS